MQMALHVGPDSWWLPVCYGRHCNSSVTISWLNSMSCQYVRKAIPNHQKSQPNAEGSTCCSTENCGYAQEESLQVGSFAISPATFALEAGEELQMHVTFAPSTATSQMHSLWLTCDNGTTETYQLTGTGVLHSQFKPA